MFTTSMVTAAPTSSRVSHEIDARPRMQHRHLAKNRHSVIVRHVQAIRGQHAVVPVRRVRIERDVGDHGHLGHGFFHRPHRA